MTNTVVPHHHSVDRDLRAAMTKQQSTVIWFTGPGASGKSTMAGSLEA